MIGHQISATDKQIDNLVYELYGLTDEEIRIVEEGDSPVIDLVCKGALAPGGFYE